MAILLVGTSHWGRGNMLANRQSAICKDDCPRAQLEHSSGPLPSGQKVIREESDRECRSSR